MARRIRLHWFERRRDGTILVHLLPAEVETLALLVDDLVGLLRDPDRAALAYQRLFPPAYLDPDESAAEQAYGAFVHSGLLTSRLEQLARLRAFLAEVAQGAVDNRSGHHSLILDDDACTLLLGVLNDLRLAFGAVLNVTDDDDAGADGPPFEERDAEPDPAVVALAASRPLYDALTALQGELIELMMLAMPLAGVDD